VASIERRTNGRWRARYRGPDGKSRSKVFDRKTDAERFLTSVENSKLTGAYVDPGAGKRRFEDWWAEWRRTQVGLRPSTRARDESYARSLILPAFGTTPLAAIDHLVAQRWVADISARGLAPATVREAARLTSKAMRAAVRARLIASNPFDEVELPRIESGEMRFLTPAEVATLADSIVQPRKGDRQRSVVPPAGYRSLVLLGAYGGLRFGELAGLRRRHVDLVGRRVDVVENCVEVSGVHQFGPPKTKAGRRSVPIPRVVATALEEHAAALGPDELVFTAPQGGPMRASLFRRRFWQPAVEAADVAPLRIHDLRHTAVALWIAAGATPLEIARRAGHTSTSVVLDRYGHLLPGAEDRVTDALDALAAAAPQRVAPVVALRR